MHISSFFIRRPWNFFFFFSGEKKRGNKPERERERVSQKLKCMCTQSCWPGTFIAEGFLNINDLIIRGRLIIQRALATVGGGGYAYMSPTTSSSSLLFARVLAHVRTQLRAYNFPI